MAIDYRIIAFGSLEYEDLVMLRVEALLNPIGIPASYIQAEVEKTDVFIGAFEGEGIRGCCVLTEKEKGVFQLRQMAVHPAYRGKDIGAAILVFAEKVAKEKGFKKIMMHARKAVVDFYRKSGYEIAGPEFSEVGIAHHKMEKTLG